MNTPTTFTIKFELAKNNVVKEQIEECMTRDFHTYDELLDFVRVRKDFIILYNFQIDGEINVDLTQSVCSEVYA